MGILTQAWTPEEVQTVAIVAILIGIFIILIVMWPYRDKGE